MTDHRPPIRPRDDDWPETRDYHREQADKIERLREDNKRLQMALELVVNCDALIPSFLKQSPDDEEFQKGRIEDVLNAAISALAAAQEDSRE